MNLGTDDVTQASPVDAGAPLSLRVKRPRARRRAVLSKAMTLVLLLAVVAAVVPLVSLLASVLVNGWRAIDLDFFTQVQPMSFRERGGGYVHGIIGTLYMTGVAAVVSVPLGIAAAIHLSENPKSRYADVVRFFTDVMTGVPSIFVGLAVYALLVSGSGGLGLGFGTLPGAAALAIIMLPIVVRSSEEMLRLVPADLRAASAGLGARQWQTALRVTLPAAAPGLTTGAILAVARGAGETAPLLMTALGAHTVVLGFTGTPQADVGLLMLDGFRQPFAPGIERAWGGGFALILIVLVLSIVARRIARRSQI